MLDEKAILVIRGETHELWCGCDTLLHMERLRGVVETLDYILYPEICKHPLGG